MPNNKDDIQYEEPALEIGDFVVIDPEDQLNSETVNCGCDEIGPSCCDDVCGCDTD